MAGNFELTFFSPVGFVFPKYLNNNCLFCKGHLADLCVQCSEKNTLEKCDVNENKNMHVHCQKMLEKNTTDD